MEKRLLGRTGLEVSVLGFGGMELQHCNLNEAKELLNCSIDNGINYVDTSPEYINSEELIGKAIAHRRNEYILATKCGDNLTGVGPKYIFDRETCLSNLDRSLKLLKTDYIDVWQLHAVMPEYIANGQADDVIKCMEEVKKAGKVRFLGVTIKNGMGNEELYPSGFGYKGIKEFMNWDVLDVIQIVYGGLTRQSEIRIQDAYEKGKGIVARGIIKKYKSFYDDLYEKSNIQELFEEGETRTDFLIRYALTHKAITCAIIGTKNKEHMLSNIKAANKGVLAESVYEEAKKRLNKVGIIPGQS